MLNWLKKTAATSKGQPEGQTADSRDDGPPAADGNANTSFKDQGDVHFGNGDLAAAIACYRQAITLDPRYAKAYNNLGFAYQNQGNLEQAVEQYRNATAIDQGLLTAHLNLGLALLNLGQTAAAEESLRQVIQLSPEHVVALQLLGAHAAQRGDYVQGETLLRRAIALDPAYAEAYHNLGTVLKETRRLPEAEATLRRALELKPGMADTHCNLGLLLLESGRTAEAEASYRRALQLNPDNADANNNLGFLLAQSMRLHEAEAPYRRALALKPDYADAHFNLGILLLTLGRYDEAWPHYEYRYHPKKVNIVCTVPDLPFPQWRGQSLAGKSLVIWPEQGFGDYIQCARYSRLIRAQGVSRLTLVCSPPLKQLLETVDGVDAVITDISQLGQHDFWSFILSIPRYFGTTLETIPAAPYMKALPARVDNWRKPLPAGKFKVGLVWKGRASHSNDANRSLPGLQTLAPLWTVSDVTFVSLQKGQGEEQAHDPPADQPIVHLGSDIHDFADTAAILDQLDLLICVDTAIAHIAGAMGKPCWVLLPAYATDWRWLTGRADSPWYPGIRLFRQEESGNWDATVERIRSGLQTFCQGSR